MIIDVDAETVAEAMQIAPRTARRWGDNWVYRTESVQGGFQKRYILLTLPPDVREPVTELLARRELARVRNADPESLRALIETTIETGARLPIDVRRALCERELSADNPALPATAAPAPMTQLSDDQRRTAEARMALLSEIDRLAGASTVKMAIAKLSEMARTGKLSPRLAALVPVANARSGEGRALSPRTMKRWRALLKQGGFAALAPKEPPRDMVPPWWARDFLPLWRQPQKPALTEALRLLTADYQAAGLVPPTYNQVRNFVSQLGTIERNRGRMGPRELKNLKGYIKRDDSELDPLDVVQMDGHQYDAEIQHPFHGGPFRPEITTVIDTKTRVGLGFSVGLAESAQAIMDALRHAVLRFGVPAILYTDRGSGNLAGIVDAPVTGMLARIGTTHTKSLPYNSQARGRSERAHQTIWVASAKRLPTYIGKPMDAEAKNKVHKLTRRDLVAAKVLLPSWRQFVEQCKVDLDTYNNTPHRGLPKIVDTETGKLRHQSPMEAMKAAFLSGWTPERVSDDTADDLFRPHREVSVRRCVVTLSNLEYHHAGLEEYHGDRVQVAYEPTDPAIVWVKTLEGRLICKAELDGHKRGFLTLSIRDQSRETRADKRRERLQHDMDEVEAERRGPPVDAARILADAEKVAPAPAQVITLHPAPIPQRLQIDAKDERFARWKTIEASLMAGLEVTEADLRWHKHYSKDAECTSRLRAETMIANGLVSGAQPQQALR